MHIKRSRSTLAAAGSLVLLTAIGTATLLLGHAAHGAEPPKVDAAAPAIPSFDRDVMAVLSKAGCNMGVCHGNQNGKGGFKLSLRGEDASFDYLALTRDQLGRRADPLTPAHSLLLRKPILDVPHEGGLRLKRDSLEYQILHNWIAAGLPRGDRQTKLVELSVSPRSVVAVEPAVEAQLQVLAKFSDGSTRDVTRLAVYEPVSRLAIVDASGHVTSGGPGETTILVRYLHQQLAVPIAWVPARADFAWQETPAENPIDRCIEEKLKSLRILPAPLCDDRVFLRRAYYDLLGSPPTADEARTFLANTDADKRAKLVDELLARPEFADYWAMKWADLLKNEERVLDRKGVQAFQAWIRTSIATNKPVDEFCRELIAARGSTYTSPAANYYRANRDPLTRAEATAQLFLGTRLQCARCHNHPFERWTQDDYYNWASFFARVDYKVLENRRGDKNDKHEFDGEQIVWLPPSGEVKNPRTEQNAVPRFLGDAGPSAEALGDRLQTLADWVTDADNPLFARVQANRIWFHLMGRGVVEPIDDFRSTNLPANPALLDHLTTSFVASKFDLKRLIREIMTSRAYQRSTETNATNASDEANFARATIRRLPAEPLLDAMHLVCDVPTRFKGYPVGVKATQIPGVQVGRDRGLELSPDDRFLRVFGKPPRLLTCECERSTDSTLVQSFDLISGEMLNGLLTTPNNRLGRMIEANLTPEEIVTELCWWTINRAPTPSEMSAGLEIISDARNQRQAVEDLAWALINAKEFVFRE